MTAGLDFNRKARLLRGIIKSSGHKNSAELLGFLNQIQNESKRNVFAHSYWFATPTDITFLERTRYGELKASQHTYTLTKFREHVLKVEAASSGFERVLDVKRSEMTAFFNALGVNVR